MKADLHIHTQYSFDCSMPLDKIVSRCLESGINCVAIADHGTVEGALKIQKLAPFKVIVAEEVLTPLGEIMGVFLTETVPSGLPAEEVIARIRAQGGLVCLPHPFDRLRSGFFRHDPPVELLEKVDIIECFNARSPFSSDGKKARRLAGKYKLLCSAGSDAHTLGEIGNAYVEMPDFSSKEEFRSALAQGNIFGHKTKIWVHFPSTLATLRSKFFNAVIC